jgi:hypothetical protein
MVLTIGSDADIASVVRPGDQKKIIWEKCAAMEWF